MKILCRKVHSHVLQRIASSHGAARHQLPTVRLCPGGPPRQDDFMNALRWTLSYWEGKWFARGSCTLLAEPGLAPATFTT